VEHLRDCHSKSPLETKALIILPNWLKFKAVTKELKLIKRLPKGERCLCGLLQYVLIKPSDIITCARVINYWLIDANTHVLSPLMNTSVNALKPNIVTTKLEANEAIKAANKHLSATTAMVVMDPYES